MTADFPDRLLAAPILETLETLETLATRRQVRLYRRLRPSSIIASLRAPGDKARAGWAEYDSL